MKKFSIVIPIYNEQDNIKNLILEIFNSIDRYLDYEIIIINDGSNDKTLEIINNLKIDYPIKLINNIKNSGQSFSINEGIINAKNNVIVTLDGDGQNNPRDIQTLLDLYFEKKIYSLIGGIRHKRKDSLVKILSSKFANKFRSFLLKDDCLDTGCSLKVFEKSIFVKFPFFNGIHRFLPALFKNYGKKTFFVNVDHRYRKFGVSKYGTFDRAFRGLRDLIKVAKIIKKFKRDNA